jgi:hypothetical protein
MDSNQTLHDFVLNLITNPEARSAFQLDPEATLNEAGLGDITVADVQDVVPLVVDYTQVHGSAGLNPAAIDPDLGSLGADPTDVVGQLQAITQQLAAAAQPTSIDGNLAAVGTFAVDPGSLGVGASTVGGIGLYADPSGGSADLSGANDLTGTLDSAVVGPVTEDATGTVDATADATLATADGGLGGLLGNGGPLGNGLAPQLDNPAGLGDPLGGITGDVPVSVPELGLDEDASPLGGVTGSVDETLDNVGGDLLGGGAGASAEAEAQAGADAQGGAGLLDDPTGILF